MDSNYIYNKKLIYRIESNQRSKDRLMKILREHTEIKFVSFVAIDLMGKDTDEKIPIDYFIKNIDELFEKGIQTDGSSVNLGSLATLSDARVDLIPDKSSNWYVDYNYENIDMKTNLPVGTLRIWSFLKHNGEYIDSRYILKNSITKLKKYLLTKINSNNDILKFYNIDPINNYEDIQIMLGTELEFWVRTPYNSINIRELVLSQSLKEQYWKRTHGVVRTALEQVLQVLQLYNINPEMGHKEVGGVKTYIAENSKLDNHIVEQLEIDWKYNTVLEAIDNELIVRIMVKEIFRLNGLEVSFNAKPIIGVAGSGEHCHLSIMLNTSNGKKVNLIEPTEDKTYMSKIGWGMIMGILKNYEYINPFISNTIDSLNRLKPGYEAPTHVVASIGRSYDKESRNRTVLACLIRDKNNPMSTRFEVRSPNPTTNIYLAVTAMLGGIMDGLEYTLQSRLKNSQIEKEFCKNYGDTGEYLLKDRKYREEDDIFIKYTDKERDKNFGTCPKTVYENISRLKDVNIIEKILDRKIIDAHMELSLKNWILDLEQRIIPKNQNIINSYIQLKNDNDYDNELWDKIIKLKKELVKDDKNKKSLITEIIEYCNKEDFKEISKLQIEMDERMQQLERLYNIYKGNQV